MAGLELLCDDSGSRFCIFVKTSLRQLTAGMASVVAAVPARRASAAFAAASSSTTRRALTRRSSRLCRDAWQQQLQARQASTSSIRRVATTGRNAQQQEQPSPSIASPSYAGGSNPAMTFPCIDANELRARRLAAERGIDPASASSASTSSFSPSTSEIASSITSSQSSSPSALDVTEAESAEEVDNSGPEPAYSKIVSGYKTYHHSKPLELDYGGVLPEYDIAYETWGELNEAKDNVILIHTGLSASSHAHSTPENPSEGWWEKFIGPGKAIDTNRFFAICTNVLGGCYGSTGPSSIDPVDGRPYATRFPIISIFDMVRAQFQMLDSLGVSKLYASVGSSMGGMQSVAAAHLFPERVGKVVSISGSARSSPSSIALRYAQRSGQSSLPSFHRVRDRPG